ncbi:MULTISPECIES: glycosyltransferase family 4 protein [Stenotrophomonas]|uniref:glycosyltransferase family 4 protein n=1 Tax=Stenotrophomonas TaxID=40323 RepID=UPI0013111365|nr:glycosyltransferase family 4 protein [Stenotrophomonas maltophilia]MDG2509007.1 glycosyltransferase family 4 protein [Stenotrophomonas maltophilia]WMR43549.1 glycosyltransferase family 4 protein [Stenotrophomonas maltophilia]
MRVAIIHDWLTVNAGAEKVLKQMLLLYPQAEIFTLVDFLPEEDRSFLGSHKVHTSFIQKMPRARKSYRSYLPLMPLAIEQFDLSGFDLVLSSSYAVAKGVLTGPDQIHVCYCHSPIRYAWDLQPQYLRESGLDRGLKSAIARIILSYIRMWDVRTANGVDHFIANSTFIARRIRKVYGRESVVIPPPVDIPETLPSSIRQDYYVTASRLVPYKRIDLIIEAFNQMPDRKLVVIGSGPMLEQMQRLAKHNVSVLGYQPQEVLEKHLAEARAFVFAAEEDFGIAPVEAQAFGTPVIAYGKGGILDSVKEGETGSFFSEQSSLSIQNAIRSFELRCAPWNHTQISKHANKFSPDEFRNRLAKEVQLAHQNHQRQKNHAID